MKKTVHPVQKRSQETREKLMKAAFTMYVKKGYHSATVDEIAAEAGLSTGIAYRYFKNKKDMLLSSLSYAFKNIRAIAEIEGAEEINSAEEYLAFVLGKFEILHDKYRDIHNELEGLRYTDEDVKKLYEDIEKNELEKLTKELADKLDDTEYLREKVCLAVGIMEHYCHLTMNDTRGQLDKDKLRSLTIASVISLF